MPKQREVFEFDLSQCPQKRAACGGLDPPRPEPFKQQVRNEITKAGMRSLVVFFIALCLTLSASVSKAQEVAVYPKNAEDRISRDALRAIFSKRLQKWPDGTPVTVFVLSDRSPLHIAFCKQVLNVFPHQLRRAWDRLVYSGTGQSPLEVASESEMRERIATTPGAIGYLPDKGQDDQVKILPVR